MRLIEVINKKVGKGMILVTKEFDSCQDCRMTHTYCSVNKVVENDSYAESILSSYNDVFHSYICFLVDTVTKSYCAELGNYSYSYIRFTINSRRSLYIVNLLKKKLS